MKFSLVAVLGLAATAIAAPFVEDLEHMDAEVEETVEMTKRQLPRPLIRGPFDYDLIVSVLAQPNQVVDSENQPTGGLPNSRGRYRMGFIASENMICFNITHFNFRGTYESPAATATHLHEAARGRAGPPRISFPNPSGPNRERNVVGCRKGPFRTGLDDDAGNDTGRGFNVRQVIRNPQAFFIDAHSSRAIDGAFRGQLPRMSAVGVAGSAALKE